MAMSAVYTNFGGMLLHENRGGTERQYVSDTLGSLVGELDSTQATTYTAEYWPYGEVQTETGTNTSPWNFVGLFGYLRDLATLLYVRARHYLNAETRWLTVDPIALAWDVYLYCLGDPCTYRDQEGTRPQKGKRRGPPVKNGCEIYICNKRAILGHACVDVETPNGGCSASIYPDGVFACSGVHKFPKDWDCELISTDCELAAAVCACIAVSQNDNYLPWVCWGFARNMVCCGCHMLPPSKRRDCEVKNCPPAFISPLGNACPSGWGAPNCKHPWY